MVPWNSEATAQDYLAAAREERLNQGVPMRPLPGTGARDEDPRADDDSTSVRP